MLEFSEIQSFAVNASCSKKQQQQSLWEEVTTPVFTV